MRNLWENAASAVNFQYVVYHNTVTAYLEGTDMDNQKKHPGGSETADQTAWDTFEESGRIADYLSYVDCVRCIRSEGGVYADQNQRNYPETEEYR